MIDKPDYPADGSDSHVWDPNAIAGHSDVQEEINRRGVQAAKAALQGIEPDSAQEQALPDPTPEEAATMLTSAEARDVRRRQRMGYLKIGPDFMKRGRRRADVSHDLFSDLEPVIDDDVIVALGRRIRPAQPLFDQFTKGHHVEPTKQAIEEYATGGNRATHRVNRRKKDADPGFRPVVDNEKMRRQSMHIADQLQRNLLVDRDMAALRHSAVWAVRRAIEDGAPIDSQAANFTADAIQDFGYALWENASKPGGNFNDTELGVRIVKVGLAAEDDSTVFAKNRNLLKLVQIEQTARRNYWSERFDASVRYTGDRLPADIKSGEEETQAEIARLNAIQRETPDPHAA